MGGVESVFREDQVQIAELHPTAVFPDKVLQVNNFRKKELFSNMLPELIPQGKIHSVVEGLFSSETLPKVKLAGRSKHFLKNWKKLTGDKKILEIVQGYKIPFHMDPIQVRVPHSQKMNTDQSTLVNQEIESMLQKVPFRKCHMFQESF